MVSTIAGITQKTAIVYAFEYLGATSYHTIGFEPVGGAIGSISSSATADPQGFKRQVRKLAEQGFALKFDLSDEILKEEARRSLSTTVRVLSHGRVEAFHPADRAPKIYRVLSPLEVLALQS